MTKRAVRETYDDLLGLMAEEILDVVAEKAGGGLAGRAVRRGARRVTDRIEDRMGEQGEILLDYTAARARGDDDLRAYRRDFLDTNPVYTRYEGEEKAALETELLDHFDQAAQDLQPLVESETDDFWDALAEEYTRGEAEQILDRHFSQAERFTEYRDDIFSSKRIGNLVIDILETAEGRFEDYLTEKLDEAYGPRSAEGSRDT